MTKPSTPEGARLLKLYIDKTSKSVSDFCAKHSLDRVQVQRYLNGRRTRMSVAFAGEIETATGGEVPMRSWLPKEPKAKKNAKSRKGLTLRTLSSC